jgi:hypothetical protein
MNLIEEIKNEEFKNGFFPVENFEDIEILVRKWRRESYISMALTILLFVVFLGWIIPLFLSIHSFFEIFSRMHDMKELKDINTLVFAKNAFLISWLWLTTLVVAGLGFIIRLIFK